MLRKALEGADKRGDELVKVGHTLHALAHALMFQVGRGKAFLFSHHTHTHTRVRLGRRDTPTDRYKWYACTKMSGNDVHANM